MKLIARSLPIVFCCFLWTSCDREKRLPNGYRLTIIESVPRDVFLIVDRERSPITPANVPKLGKWKGFVFGLFEPAFLPGSSQEFPPFPAGYFIINTRTGEVDRGLTETDFLRRLREIGIKDKPELVESARF